VQFLTVEKTEKALHAEFVEKLRRELRKWSVGTRLFVGRVGMARDWHRLQPVPP